MVETCGLCAVEKISCLLYLRTNIMTFKSLFLTCPSSKSNTGHCTNGFTYWQKYVIHFRKRSAFIHPLGWVFVILSKGVFILCRGNTKNRIMNWPSVDMQNKTHIFTSFSRCHFSYILDTFWWYHLSMLMDHANGYFIKIKNCIWCKIIFFSSAVKHH